MMKIEFKEIDRVNEFPSNIQDVVDTDVGLKLDSLVVRSAVAVWQSSSFSSIKS